MNSLQAQHPQDLHAYTHNLFDRPRSANTLTMSPLAHPHLQTRLIAIMQPPALRTRRRLSAQQLLEDPHEALALAEGHP